ncbi:MAG: filamentous hemagglutinin N-terminal domain-containing protein, partial [Waddliaceae bacterium]|nr:filamentous hemagglutinin N-terminal domain-containing protein [Waddliaceae bacterium]
MRNLAKRLLTSVATTIIGGLLLIPSQGMAIPQEPSFSDGQVGIINDGTTMTIEQHVDKAIINWDEYSIAADELVQYIQPGIESIALNKITGANPSEIMGDLLANGQIFIMNPNGILFGPDSHVNTAGLLATTLGISDADFLEGNYDFSQEQYAQLSSIINKGEITISDNGYAVIVAPLVSNEGLIVANLGTVRVGAAEGFTVNFDGNSLINFEITTPPEDSTPGTVLIPTGQVTDIIRQVVNYDGLIEGAEITESEGTTSLVATSGTVINNGTITADGSANNNAGTIAINATNVAINVTDGIISASGIGEESSGGNISINASKIGQFGEIHSDSINNNGGDIDVYASDLVYLGSYGLTTANAGLNGVGGEIIVYSPGTTLFRKEAKIEAIGGELSGDGGFIEVSGKYIVQIDGSVDVSSYNGMGGTFMIDPAFNLAVQDGAGDIDASTPNFIADQDTCTVDSAVIETVLNANSTALLQTDDGGTQTGIITIGAVIVNDAGAGASTLTINAAHDVVVNSSITCTSGTLNVNINANGAYDTPSGTGVADINAAITTNGGNFAATGVAFDNTSGIITTAAGDLVITQTGAVTVGAALSATTGAITVGSSTSITVEAAGDIDTAASSGGTITLTAAHDITLETGGTVGAATDGNIVITADNNNDGGGIFTSDAAVGN